MLRECRRPIRAVKAPLYGATPTVKEVRLSIAMPAVAGGAFQQPGWKLFRYYDKSPSSVLIPKEAVSTVESYDKHPTPIRSRRNPTKARRDSYGPGPTPSTPIDPHETPSSNIHPPVRTPMNPYKSP